jgi:hypothetical protein
VCERERVTASERESEREKKREGDRARGRGSEREAEREGERKRRERPPLLPEERLLEAPRILLASRTATTQRALSDLVISQMCVCERESERERTREGEGVREKERERECERRWKERPHARRRASPAALPPPIALSQISVSES